MQRSRCVEAVLRWPGAEGGRAGRNGWGRGRHGARRGEAAEPVGGRGGAVGVGMAEGGWKGGGRAVVEVCGGDGRRRGRSGQGQGLRAGEVADFISSGSTKAHRASRLAQRVLASAPPSAVRCSLVRCCRARRSLLRASVVHQYWGHHLMEARPSVPSIIDQTGARSCHATRLASRLPVCADVWLPRRRKAGKARQGSSDSASQLPRGPGPRSRSSLAGRRPSKRCTSCGSLCSCR